MMKKTVGILSAVVIMGTMAVPSFAADMPNKGGLNSELSSEFKIEAEGSRQAQKEWEAKVAQMEKDGLIERDTIALNGQAQKEREAEIAQMEKDGLIERDTTAPNGQAQKEWEAKIAQMEKYGLIVRQ